MLLRYTKIPRSSSITINCFCKAEIFPATFGSFPPNVVAGCQFTYFPRELVFVRAGPGHLDSCYRYSTEFSVNFSKDGQQIKLFTNKWRDDISVCVAFAQVWEPSFENVIIIKYYFAKVSFLALLLL